MTNKSTVVNANENLRISWLNRPEDRAAYGEFVPVANYIINTHVKEWWKNHPSSIEYQNSHFWISMCLSDADIYGSFLFHYLLFGTKTNPIELINDSTLIQIMTDMKIKSHYTN